MNGMTTVALGNTAEMKPAHSCMAVWADQQECQQTNERKDVVAESGHVRFPRMSVGF